MVEKLKKKNLRIKNILLMMIKRLRKLLSEFVKMPW